MCVWYDSCCVRVLKFFKSSRSQMVFVGLYSKMVSLHGCDCCNIVLGSLSCSVSLSQKPRWCATAWLCGCGCEATKQTWHMTRLHLITCCMPHLHCRHFSSSWSLHFLFLLFPVHPRLRYLNALTLIVIDWFCQLRAAGLQTIWLGCLNLGQANAKHGEYEDQAGRWCVCVWCWRSSSHLMVSLSTFVGACNWGVGAAKP